MARASIGALLKHEVGRLSRVLKKSRAGRFLLSRILQIANERRIRRLQDSFPFRMVLSYDRDSFSLFATLCDEYGSDKGSLRGVGASRPYAWAPHNYSDYFERMFLHRRNDVKNVFELGIGYTLDFVQSHSGPKGSPGASLRVLRDYFPNAQIFGADIDPDLLFEEDRIRTFFVDQNDPDAIGSLWETVGDCQFDLMIDDGLHQFTAGATFFQHSFQRLAVGGLYIIEDVAPAALLEYRDYFRGSAFLVDTVNLERPRLPLGDNSLVVIRGRDDPPKIRR